MSRFLPPEYFQRFPEVIPIEGRPERWQSIVEISGGHFRVPAYMAGWTLTTQEIFRKFQPKVTVLNVELVLNNRWTELNFDKIYENHPIVRTVRVRELIDNDYIFVFAENGMDEELNDFEEYRELVFEVMCQLFGIVSEEHKKIIRGRYRWYRAFVHNCRITDAPMFELDAWRENISDAGS